MDTNVVVSRPAISVIVPVYNVEKYLERCLDSIFNQQFSSAFEVIAVEDCSTDNSLHILKEYQKRDKRLVILEHENNKKVSIARSTGLKFATGDYIMFVDSDDCLLPNAFENLYKKCIETDADVIVYNHIIFDNHDNRKLIKNIKSEFITTDKIIVHHHFFGALWNKILKRTLVENLVCGHIELSISEDLLYGTEVLVKAKKICLMSEAYYLYFVNTNSLTHTVKLGHFLKNQIVVLNQIEMIIEKYEIDSQLDNKLLNYFEKWIYLSVAKMHYWNKVDFEVTYMLLDNFKKSTIMSKSRIHRLELAIGNKKNCLIEVKKRFGFKMALSIYLKSFKNN